MGTLNVVFSCKQPSINVYINSFYVDFFVECFFYAVTLREKSGKKDFVFFCVCGGWEVVSTSLMGILTNRNTIYIYITSKYGNPYVPYMCVSMRQQAKLQGSMYNPTKLKGTI